MCMSVSFQDENGNIENDELHGFVKDLLELAYEVVCLFSFKLKQYYKIMNIIGYSPTL